VDRESSVGRDITDGTKPFLKALAERGGAEKGEIGCKEGKGLPNDYLGRHRRKIVYREKESRGCNYKKKREGPGIPLVSKSGRGETGTLESGELAGT